MTIGTKQIIVLLVALALLIGIILLFRWRWTWLSPIGLVLRLVAVYTAIQSLKQWF